MPAHPTATAESPTLLETGRAPVLSAGPERRFAVAPMMDWTDRHCRYFLRGFSPRVLLYTEMITAEALLRGDARRLLQYSDEEQPLALQLGGSEPVRLAAAARLGEQAGYQEINLNCGCPSDRVHAGAFGACLMAQPALVADCVAAMCAAVAIPVTVKMRIGVIGGRGQPVRERLAADDEGDYERLAAFTSAVSRAGCQIFIVHARQAVLGGLSPKENREVPPLQPQVVRRLAGDFPRLTLVLNGGVRTSAEATEALTWCAGVMLGREAYHRPYVITELHHRLLGDGWRRPDERELLERMAHYAERERGEGVALASITRHMLGLCAGQPGARAYRQRLSEGARDPGAGAGLLRDFSNLQSGTYPDVGMVGSNGSRIL